MVTAKNGRARAIRAFVMDHPDCTSREVIAALGLPAEDIRRELSRMAKLGTVIAEGGVRGSALNRYKVGREIRPIKPKAPKPPKAAKAPTPPKPPKNHPMRQAINGAEGIQRKSARGPGGQTVDEFLAHGGKVEVIPSHWDQSAHARPYVPANVGANGRGGAKRGAA